MKRYSIFKRLLDWPASRPRLKHDRWRVDMVLASDVQELQAENVELKREIAELKGRWANMVGECHG